MTGHAKDNLRDESGQEESRQWLMQGFVRAKLSVPRQNIALVCRPHLLARLDEASERSLVLVVATAGFGKTTLLDQWRQRTLEKGGKVGWLSLDEQDDDPLQLLTYVVFALAHAGIDMGRLEHLAEQGITGISPRNVLGSILQCIADHSGQVVLILDDYHRIDNREVDQVLGDLVAGAPENFCLVINTRVRPALNMPVFLASGQAMELGAEELRFSREETRAALSDTLPEETLDLLFSRTEGWPVAIQLARLLMMGEGNDPAALSQFHGGSGHIATYLTDQVVATLPDDVQAFLMQTSILERFNASLADVVTDRKDSWKILKALEPLQALILPLDDRHYWFRYHHLFADCLQELLRNSFGPADIAELHARASCWYEKEGDIVEAVRHARLAGDFDRCARLIEDAGGWELILFGGISYLRSLLRNIPDSEVRHYPRVVTAKSYLALKDGNLRDARDWYEKAVAAAAGDGRVQTNWGGLNRDLLNVGILLYTYEDRLGELEDTVMRPEVVATVPQTDGLTLAIICCCRIMYCLSIGEFERAEEQCRLAMRAMRAANTLLGLNYVYLHAGLTACYQGKMKLAEANFWEARQMAEDNFGADSGLKALADILLGALMYWRDCFTGPKQVGAFVTAFEHVVQFDAWLDIFATGLEVGAAYDRYDSMNGHKIDAVTRCDSVARERGIERLMVMVRAHRISEAVAASRGHDPVTVREASLLEAEFPMGCWRDKISTWLPYQSVANALADYYAQVDRSKAIAWLGDQIACGRHVRGWLFVIRTLVRRALMLEQAGDRTAALRDLSEAVELATGEQLVKPFSEDVSLAPLLRALQKKGREEAMDPLTRNFITSCLEKQNDSRLILEGEDAEILSPREREVIRELSHDLSNKEIARALDMTEHTVKFHLKNIFKKLGVERRAQAVEVARLRNIIT
ncbi:helix-turn-helix transcriptional regulator [Emcibacter nanhaiensis]|uniref:HTH luxR-type domain-containing protein n=1 Tax=Emcibacter nanhaiensis TaxID=1505037 RepID=A0A501PKJ9_9PROT|nr:LuxR C-terminal-related transcriptional regulator [Emcibacter nanhaiensis]TPD60246.1 hypothetical protein FIV46_09345 [Emcibacter nanhaiensis]